MVLALYKNPDGTITPLILIDVKYSLSPSSVVYLHTCLAEAQWPPRVSGENVRSPCTLFAVNKNSGMRLHLASRRNDWLINHHENCSLSNGFPGFLGPDAYKYLDDRSRVCSFLQRIARDNSFDPKFTAGWSNAVHISGSNAEHDSRRARGQPWNLGYRKGIQEAKKYLEREFEEEKRRRKIRLPSLRYFRRIFSRVRYHLPRRNTEKALLGHGANEDAAEMEDTSPTSSSV